MADSGTATTTPLALYLVEVYYPRVAAGALRETAARTRSVADELTGEGAHVRYVRSLFVPEDEVCLHLFSATSQEAVHEASRRAGTSFFRVVEAVERTGRECF